MKRNVFTYSLTLFLAASLNGAYAHKGEHEHSNGQAHAMHEEKDHQKSEQTIKAMIHKIENKDDRKIVQIKLTRIKDDKPITLDDLREVHKAKVHLLIIDDSLDDYSHIHPKSLGEPGLYEFEWSPKKQGNYRLWADLLPISTDTQEYAIADLTSDKEARPLINKKETSEATLDNYHFKLSFDSEKLIAGTPVMGKLNITDSNEAAVKDLEPVMGAFAHLVGFSEDMKTVVHIHPMGAEPTKETDRGGPELQFHIEPEKAGFVKLFAQVSIQGKALFVPFGIVVN